VLKTAKTHSEWRWTAQACEMIALYFGAKPDAAQHSALRKLWASGNRRYTPAQLEQLCAESDMISDLLEELREIQTEAAEAAAHARAGKA
jgi:hypothetical protein